MFKKGTKLKMIIKCNGLWISNVGWGCTWRAEQIKIDVPVGFSGYAFDDSDDEDSGVELTRQQSVVTDSAVSKSVETNFVDSSDGEDEGDDDGSGEEDTGEQKVVKRKVKKAVSS